MFQLQNGCNITIMVKRKSSGGGSTIYGLMAGLLLGLSVAAGVAYYVIKAPMPFMDKASRSPDASGAPDPRNAQDPNAALATRETGPVTAPSSPDQPVGQLPLAGSDRSAATGSARAPGASQSGGDALGSLIATLAPAPSASGRSQQAAAVTPPVRSDASTPTTVSPSTQAPKSTGPYFLQVGSFRVLEDAEALRAKIILMGLPVEIQRAEVNGLQVNRVRVGPFARIDDMNQTRIRLGQEKIPTAVVRQ